MSRLTALIRHRHTVLATVSALAVVAATAAALLAAAAPSARSATTTAVGANRLAASTAEAAKHAAPAAGAVTPVVSCAALAAVNLTGLDTSLSSAADVTRGSHGYCDVQGYISPNTQFEILLPESTWRGDYLQQGCGGF